MNNILDHPQYVSGNRSLDGVSAEDSFQLVVFARFQVGCCCAVVLKAELLYCTYRSSSNSPCLSCFHLKANMLLAVLNGQIVAENPPLQNHQLCCGCISLHPRSLSISSGFLYGLTDLNRFLSHLNGVYGFALDCMCKK